MTSWEPSDVGRMRLLSQGLLDPLPTPASAVHHLTCTQGQDYPGSMVSIALRTSGRDVQGVRDAYDAGEIVRSWPMRGTLFVVAAEDLGWMLSLTAEPVLRSTVRRRAELGLTQEHLERAEEVAREALGEGGLVRAQLLAAWTDAGLDVGSGRGYHTIFHLAVSGVLCQGPVEGKEQRFVLHERWITRPRELDRDTAVAEWLLRYVRSHGPVPVADFLWWTKLLKRDVAPVLDEVRAQVEVLEVDGVEHWVDPAVLADYPARKRSTSRPLLLPGFDEIVLGYGDRRAVLSREEEALVVPGNNGVFRPTLLHRGRAIGTWKRPTRKAAPVSVEPFAGSLPTTVTAALPALTTALPR
ncbi:winged helix DNA-binding domain-containing protein [Ornithinimicrobium sp. Y1694]|uniref:winged helix DNA-binding domain-containing protein n=1 Tax=Ornithinimicrobium sp. Y1694 TaxID=3418590 RepID=UPI003CE873BE